MNLAEAVQGAIEACGPWVDPAPLVRARARLEQPWRIALVGRVAAGKTTLANGLCEGTSATGLGGVTTAVEERAAPQAVVVDTPGIDDPDRAVIQLQPVFEVVDAVIWVVDGLQPATASERQVLADLVVSQTPVRAVISKADLIDPTERDSVVNRVRHLAAAWHADAMAVDLRHAAEAETLPPDLAAPQWPGARRLAILDAALTEVRAALAPLHRPPDLDTLLATWRDGVRRAVAQVDADIEAGLLVHKTEALAALTPHVPAVVAAVQAALGPDAPPRLPHPDPPTVTALGQVLASLSGREGARRVLKAGAARWLADGQIALREWWEAHEALPQRAQTRRHLDAQLDAVAAAIG